VVERGYDPETPRGDSKSLSRAILGSNWDACYTFLFCTTLDTPTFQILFSECIKCCAIYSRLNTSSIQARKVHTSDDC
jgi:hypothetical protein